MKQPIRIIVLLLAFVAIDVSAHPSAEHAVAAFSRSIEEHPEDQRLYIQRGSAYSNDDQLELALADYLKAESLGEPFLVAHHQGVLHYRMGQADSERRASEFGAARTYFDTFLDHFPGHASSLEYRARLSRDAGDHKAALADFNALFAMQRRPNPGHYVSAARILAGLEGEGIDSALAMLDKGMDKLGIIPQLQQYAIQLELERENSLKAIERLASLQPALGESPDWKIEMGELLLLTGKPAEAGQHFDAASSQLSRLRRTVARERVLKKLQKLRAGLGEAS